MRIVKASAEILEATPYLERLIERAGRVCYKSEDKMTADSAVGFIERLKASKHESVLEHGAITVIFTTDRGVSHEQVRHRLASYSQESTRYCNYSKDKFGEEITVIEPCFWTDKPELLDVWMEAMRCAEAFYFTLIKLGAKPQEARSVLPNSLKTEIVVTANPREWRHIFRMRCHQTAHPQMREVMLPLLNDMAARWPSLFADLMEMNDAAQ